VQALPAAASKPWRDAMHSVVLGHDAAAVLALEGVVHAGVRRFALLCTLGEVLHRSGRLEQSLSYFSQVRPSHRVCCPQHSGTTHFAVLGVVLRPCFFHLTC
jgi:hypothetical protein